MLQDNGANGNTTTAYWDEWSSKIIAALGLKKLVMNGMAVAQTVAAKIGFGLRTITAKLKLIVGSARIGKV